MRSTHASRTRAGGHAGCNEHDGPFRRGGRELLLAATRTGSGYAGTFALALSV